MTEDSSKTKVYVVASLFLLLGIAIIIIGVSKAAKEETTTNNPESGKTQLEQNNSTTESDNKDNQTEDNTSTESENAKIETTATTGSNCGNGIVDSGEACDTAASPNGCEDSFICMSDCLGCVLPASLAEAPTSTSSVTILPSTGFFDERNELFLIGIGSILIGIILVKIEAISNIRNWKLFALGNVSSPKIKIYENNTNNMNDDVRKGFDDKMAME